MLEDGGELEWMGFAVGEGERREEVGVVSTVGSDVDAFEVGDEEFEPGREEDSGESWRREGRIGAEWRDGEEGLEGRLGLMKEEGRKDERVSFVRKRRGVRNPKTQRMKEKQQDSPRDISFRDHRKA